jgi:hypothetical protein
MFHHQRWRPLCVALFVHITAIVGTSVLCGGVAQAQLPRPAAPPPGRLQLNFQIRRPEGTPAAYPVAPGNAPAAVPVAIVTLDRPLAAYVVRENRRGENVDIARTPVTLSKGELLVTKTSVSKPVYEKDGTTRQNLGYEVHFVDDRGAARACHLVGSVGGGGMRLAQDDGVFSADLYIELQDNSNATEGYDLPQAAHLLVTASVDRVDPDVFDIATTNAWTKVALSALNPVDPVPVTVRASVDLQGLVLDLPVVRPTLLLSMDPRNVVGFGLETATVTVQTQGLLRPKGRKVVVAPTRGRVANPALVLDDNGTAQTTVRSQGFGDVVVGVTSASMAAYRQTLGTFDTPMRFGVFAFFGGALGGLVRLGVKLQREGLPRAWRTVGLVALHVGFGAVVGLAAAILVAVGFNVLPLALRAPAGAAEGVVAGTALLGALLGANWLPGQGGSGPPPAGAPAAVTSRNA